MSATRQRPTPVYLALALVGLVVLLGIPLVTDSFQTFQFALVASYTIAIIGLNLLTGYSGQISLGNGAFMAIGGYTTALLVKRLGVPYGLTIPLAGLLAGLVGVLVGIPALRLRGIYLAMATFALALSVPPVLNNYDHFTGGHVGINLRPARAPFGIDLSNEQWLYFLGWGLAAVLFVPAYLLTKSRTGRAWMAVRDSETAAMANGISIAYYKTLAFGLSAFYAGVAGSLLIIDLTYVNPDSFSLGLSLSLLIGVVVGGLANLWGPLLGGLLVVWLPYLAEKGSSIHVGPVTLGGKPDIGFGLLLILIVFFAPSGIAGLLQRLLGRYARRRQAVREQPVLETASQQAPPG